MNVKEHELWQILVSKSAEEDPNVASTFVDAVWKVCQYGIVLSKTIRDTFKTYTLHDETHICNVMTNMLKLIGNLKTKLTRDECAMLIMAACCHDIGMSVTDEEKIYLRSCPDCMQTYLEKHPKDYNIAYERGLQEDATITDEILQHYIRANHHKRVYEKLQNVTWPEILGHSMSVEDLISVCQNHGEDAADIMQLQNFDPDLDLYLCSVLLRLGDILDFDATRAPDSLYRYINLAHLDGMENEKSRLEWQKHQASRGFKFVDEGQRKLIYRAECTNIQIEQAIVSYLNWIDSELTDCGKIIRYMEKRWHTLMLPWKVQRKITSKGYLSGEYKLTLDQDRVLDLLVGRELYSDPAVFVRELIQNAIDAVRTRKQMDKNLPSDWTPQINIRTWVDNEGFYWFRIEDNGIGMTEQTIKEYFLKVGHSYYNSDQFHADKIRCGADINYKPISRFGIGILSCFMSDPKNNRVEVTTKHFKENGANSLAYRLSINGISGYYYIASDEHWITAPKMPNNPSDDQSFISKPGTVIAVRTNLYRSGCVQGFKDIIDKYVVYPEVPIHYDGIEGVYNYKTEQEFVDFIQSLTHKSSDGIYQPVERIPVPEEYYSELLEKFPEYIFEEKPSIGIYCLPINDFTDDPLIKGVMVFAQAEWKGYWNEPKLDIKYVPKLIFSIDSSYYERNALNIGFLISEDAKHSLIKRVKSAINTQYPQLKIDGDTYNSLFEYRHLLSSLSPDGDNDLAEIRACMAIYFSSHYLLSTNLFERFTWYQSLFSQYLNSTKAHYHTSIYINAHNGIFTNQSPIISYYGIIHGIIMLKDKYCPSLNLSRDTIDDLPLEACYSLAALVDSIEHSLKKIQLLYSTTFHIWYPKSKLISLKDYWSVLESASFPPSKLHFSTDLGSLTLSEIKSALEEHEKLILFEDITNTFHMAALLQQFDLKADFTNDQKIIIYVVKEDNTTLKEKLLPFPPCLFVPPFSDDCTAMGVSTPWAIIDLPYNASHTFSQWLIQNGDALQKRVPGIYSQIINQLQQIDKRIENTNASLSVLRTIPNLGIKVPQDLTLDDFIIK